MARGNSRALSELGSPDLDAQIRASIGDKAPTLTKVRSTVLKLLADYSEAPKGMEDDDPDKVDKAISDAESQTSKKLYEAIGEFGRAMMYYQSNDGDRDKSVLVRAFKDLPPVLQKTFSAKPSELTKMFRGDGSRQYGGLRDVASFTKSEGVASLFGTVLWKGTDIESVEAVIDTAKVSEFFFNDKLEERLEYHPRYKDYSFSIGDDEGEVIAVGIKWKPGVGGDEWAADNKRFRTQR
jgi:hypothetical protein